MTSNPLNSIATRHTQAYGGELVVSPETIEMLVELGGDDDPGLLDELIELYLDDATDRVKALREARSGGDVAQIGRAAHALKSASANIGALPFADICREIESAARAESDQLDELVVRGQAMYNEVDSALRALLTRKDG